MFCKSPEQAGGESESREITLRTCFIFYLLPSDIQFFISHFLGVFY